MKILINNFADLAVSIYAKITKINLTNIKTSKTYT